MHIVSVHAVSAGTKIEKVVLSNSCVGFMFTCNETIILNNLHDLFAAKKNKEKLDEIRYATSEFQWEISKLVNEKW